LSRSPLLRLFPPRRREALPSSRITLLSTCPALRPRWCPARLPWREQDCCLPSTPSRRLWVRLPELVLPSTIIHFSEFNDTACVLALPLLRTPPLGDRTSVRLPTWWLAFGRVGLEYSSHPLGNVDMFQEVSPLSSHPEFSSAREAACWRPPGRLSRTRSRRSRYRPTCASFHPAPGATRLSAPLRRPAQPTKSLPVREPLLSAGACGRGSQARATSAPAHQRGHRSGTQAPGIW
jgi:hypothetical protein